jgi:hypothetical protein
MNPAMPGLAAPGLDFQPVDFSVPNPTAALLAGSLAARSYLFIPRPWDPDALARTVAYLSSDGYASGAGDTLPDGTPLAHQLFDQRLVRGGVLNYATEAMSFSQSPAAVSPSGYFQPSNVPSWGVIQLAIADDDPATLDLLRLQWRDAVIEEYLGAPDWPLSQFARIAKGIAAGIAHDPMILSVSWGDLTQRLKRDAQPRTYRGMGGALRFASSASASGTLPCPAGAMTWNLWIRAASSAATVKRFACWRNGTAAGLRSLDMGSAGANRPRAAIRNDAGTLFEAIGPAAVPVTASLQDGTHLTAVLDTAAMVLRLVVNGATVATTAVTGTFLTVLSTVHIASNEAAGEFFDGDEDEFQVWSIARADADILATRDKEISSTTTGLYAYYKCNDQAPGNVTVYDSCASPHNLNFSGALWIGSLTGGPSIAGKKIPRTLGRGQKVEPVSVDDANGTWQWNSGPVDSISALEHAGLQAYTFDSDVADINAAAPAAGHWVSCNAHGMLKLNAVVSHHLAVTGKGDNAGGYVEDPAGIAKKLALETGTADDLDLISFATVSGAYPYAVSAVTRLDTVSYDSLIVSLLWDNLMGWRTVTRDGKLSVGVLALPGPPKWTLGINDVTRGGVALVLKTDPVKQTNFSYDRYALVQGPADLAVTSQETIADLGQEFRVIQTPVDAQVIAANPSAPTWDPKSSIVLPADGVVESAREQAFWGTEKRVYAVQLTEGLHQYSIGDSVLLQMPIEGLDNGFLGVVVGLKENVPSDNGLTLIGSMLPRPGIILDSGSPIVLDSGATIGN